MFNKIVDVFKEALWLKAPAKRKSVSKKVSRPKKPAVVKKKTTAKSKKSVAVKAAPAKAAAKPAKAVKKADILDPALKQTGEITHYFDRIKVCVVKITQGTVLIGDKLTIIGPKSKFVQKVWSMQIESEDVKVAKKGQLIGIKVDKAVAVGDKVYK